MSIGKRLIDLARANLNALLERAAGDTPLDQLTDDELEAELLRRKQRKLREAEEQKQRESAERAARERAAQRGRSVPPPRRPPPSQKRTVPPPRPTAQGERRLRDLYAQLEVPYGAPFEEVKKSFRRLMRKYHPDLHVANPVKHKTATQLTASLTAAYNELERHLAGGRAR